MYRRSTVITIWSVLLAGAAYLFLFEPGKTGFFPPCMFRLLTGFTCPGCGSTRAMHQMLHGHFLAAFELNPLLLLAIPFAGLLYPPLYARHDPELLGFPFFYWYQLAWVPLAAVLTIIVYKKVRS